MDFFARQDTARAKTRQLELYFAAGIIGTIVLVYLVAAVSMQHWAHGTLWDGKLFCGVTLVTLAIILIGTLIKMAELSSGGSAVAEMLGAKLVDPSDMDPGKRRLLNVIEEMAIASGTPIPQVYVLENETGINAFAAGHSTKDMVICVTRGTLLALTRDELQGVIGHEYSHILNGDMRLNIRLMGLVYGLLCLVITGRVLLNVSESRNKKNSLPLLGIGLMAAGGIGWFFGQLIKSAVSRQREFLADAASVQFTRNPTALAAALKKVASCNSQLSATNAEEASHLYFANGLSEPFTDLLATHPPLHERIRALEPDRDGKLIAVDFAAIAASNPIQRTNVPLNNLGRLAGTVVLDAATLTHSPIPTPRHLAYAENWRADLTPELEAAAREPMTAVALSYAMVLSQDGAICSQQLGLIEALAETGMRQEVEKLVTAVQALPSPDRLPLATMALTPLRQLSFGQFQTFQNTLNQLVAANAGTDLFAYSLQKMVLRRLEPRFVPPKRTVVQYYVLRPLIADCGTLLSALAYAGDEDVAKVQAAFRLGAARLNLPELPLAPKSDCGIGQLDAALDRLNLAAPQLKKIFLEAGAQTIAADGVIAEHEAELFRAIADALDCPIPPFIEL